MLARSPLRWSLMASVALGACGQPSGLVDPSAAAPLDCPAHGVLRREDCRAVADDFGAVDFAGALRVAGADRGAEARIAALREAGQIAKAIREERVALCESHNRCELAPAMLVTEDARLTKLMTRLLDAWDGRQFGSPEGVARFHEGVLALGKELAPGGAAAPVAAALPAPKARSPRVLAGGQLTAVEGEGLEIERSPAEVTVKVRGAGAREVLRTSSSTLPLVKGKRYLLRVAGAYEPETAPLLPPGAQLTVRLRARGASAGALGLSIRSIEDVEPSAPESFWPVVAGKASAHEVTLTAPATTSGHFLALVTRDGPIDVDDVEVEREGRLIAFARAEEAVEPGVRSSCARVTVKPLGGRTSYRCAGGNEVTLAEPASHLGLAVVGRSGRVAAELRTQSLEGGRSLDAALDEDADLVVRLHGPGRITLRAIEVTEVAATR